MKTQYAAGRAENFIYGFLDMGPPWDGFQTNAPTRRFAWVGLANEPNRPTPM